MFLQQYFQPRSVLPSNVIVGVDEAGRGPLAGPVVAAALIPHRLSDTIEIADSKKLSPPKREQAFEQIIKESIGYAVVAIGPEDIDRINIREATRLAMLDAANFLIRQCLSFRPDVSVHLLIDGNMKLATNNSQETIIKGDRKLRSIGAASILAKVSRDRLMLELDKKYPGYGFALHKGYPTAFHKERIRELGPLDVHRKSFSGVRDYWGKRA